MTFTEEKAPVAVESMRWAEALCESGTSGSDAAVVLHFGSGIRGEIRDGRVAAELLGALGVRVC